jgi:DNA-binding XRE family transcriptional regulator
MRIVEKAHHIEDSKKLIAVSAEEAGKILEYAKQIDPQAHFVEETPLSDGFISPHESGWYQDVKRSWHPGITLRIRRENAGLTQAQLSRMTGLAVANISAIENGRRSMGLNVAKKLATALKRPVSEFIEKS